MCTVGLRELLRCHCFSPAGGTSRTQRVRLLLSLTVLRTVETGCERHLESGATDPEGAHHPREPPLARPADR